MRRLLGLMLIVRAFAPFLALLILAVAGSIILNDLRIQLEAPVQNIQREVDELEDVANNLKDNVAAVESEITAVVEALQVFDLSVLVPTIPSSITIPSLNIPDVTLRVPDVPDGVSISTGSFSVAGLNFTYPNGISVRTTDFTLVTPNLSSFNIQIPGLGALDTALQTALAPLTRIFDVFDPVFKSIGALNATLKTVPDSFDTIAAEGEAMINGLEAVISKWSQTLTVVLVVLGLLALNYFAAPFLDDLTRGWRMLRGLPVT